MWQIKLHIGIRKFFFNYIQTIKENQHMPGFHSLVPQDKSTQSAQSNCVSTALQYN